MLLLNSDRHHGHLLHGEHWAITEHESTNRMMRPVLIDHAASLRPEAHVTMEHDNAFGTGSIKVYSPLPFPRVIAWLQGIFCPPLV